MKKRVRTIISLILVSVLLCSHTNAFAGNCPFPNAQDHNYYSYVYFANEHLAYFEDIPNGDFLPVYCYAVYVADKYGVCICGDCKLLEKDVITRKVLGRIDYN